MQIKKSASLTKDIQEFSSQLTQETEQIKEELEEQKKKADLEKEAKAKQVAEQGVALKEDVTNSEEEERGKDVDAEANFEDG